MSSILNALRKLDDNLQDNANQRTRAVSLVRGSGRGGGSKGSGRSQIQGPKSLLRPALFVFSGLLLILLLYLSFAAGKKANNNDQFLKAQAATAQTAPDKQSAQATAKMQNQPPKIERPVIILPRIEFGPAKENDTTVEKEPTYKTPSYSYTRQPASKKIPNRRKGPSMYMGDDLSVQAIAWAEDPDVSVAIINDKVVKIGDRIEGFLIKKIEKDSVIISRGRRVWRISFRIE